MVDVILVVESAKEWHSHNLQGNYHHYALLPRLGGPSTCAFIQGIPPGVYFHANVHVAGVECKYGVVEAATLKQDLQHWKHLYLAGRLHKPTVCIVNNDEITELQQSTNLPAALAASLVLLSNQSSSTTTSNIQRHSLPEIYQQIASLSYAGDLRVSVGAEDPFKIQKLVHSDGQFQRWNDLYHDSFQHLEQSGLVTLDSSNEFVEYDLQESRSELLKRLPVSLQQCTDPASLQSSLASIVAPAARNQTLKGIATAGIWKSAQYAFNKLSKGVLKR